ncbi:MAG: DUF444 family protein [Firmicutes bacterium]|nr:DUF444 family protein [Alicyclobacillaceae bacterium]MCL6497182.1 DUF444 family protein [Bacillota bacterium]
MPGSVSEGHWDLAGRGSLDQARHLDRLREAIRQKLPVVVAETPLIDGQTQKVRVPVKVLELPRFRPRLPSQPEGGVGQGPGQPGDIIARVPRGGPGSGSGDRQPGDQPGEHEIEVELDIQTAIAMVFEDLQLPNLQDREVADLVRPRRVWNSRRRHGTLPTLARRATLKEALARSLAQGMPLTFMPDDLRFRAAREEPEPVTQAAIYLLRDISGSMGGERKYLSRVLTFWIVTWLRQQYQTVAVEFWVHDVGAQKTDETQFFALSEGGGTLAAPAYQAIYQYMQVHHPAGQWNTFVFHFTDGDVADGPSAVEAARALCGSVRWFGLVELQPPNYFLHSPSRLSHLLAELPQPPYRHVLLTKRGDVLQAIKMLLQEEATA